MRTVQRLEKCVHLNAEIPIRTLRRQESAPDSIIYHKEVLPKVSAGLELSLNARGKIQTGPASRRQEYFQPTASCSFVFCFCFFQNGHGNEFLELYHSPSRANVSSSPLPLGLDGVPVCFDEENIAEVMSHGSQAWIKKGDTLSPAHCRSRDTTLESSHHATREPKLAHVERRNGQDLRLSATVSINQG